MIVTFSGIDGSGKTTRSEALVQLLRAKGLPALSSRPAYAANDAIKDFCGWAYGDRFAYFTQLDGEFYVSCLTADWLCHLARVLSKSQSQILICDRYIYDVLAQATHMKADAVPLRRLWKHFPRPEISYFLEVSPELAHARLRLRADAPIHAAEALCELQTLHDSYAELAACFDWPFVTVEQGACTENLAEEVERAWNRMHISVNR